MVREIKWSLSSKIQLEKIYSYILKDSFQNAENVQNDILISTRKLIAHPEMYPLDKFRINNDGSFRAYEIHRIRISYRITSNEIIIVRLRHTSMKPKLY